MATNSKQQILTLHSPRGDLYNAAAEQQQNIVGQRISQARNQAGISLSKFSALLEDYGVSVSAPAWAEIVNSLLTFGTVIPLMIVGIVVWKKQKTPNLFLAGFLMFAFSGLGAACLELMFYISMYGEVLMATFFYLYAVQRVKD